METPVHNPVGDAELTQALAEVMGQLRARQYGPVLSHFEDALMGSADAFVDALARHLLFEEAVLFPPLLRLDQGTARDVAALQAEHTHLRELAMDLAHAIKRGDTVRAYGVARSFLAELFGHIEREAKVADRARPMDPSVTIFPPYAEGSD